MSSTRYSARFPLPELIERGTTETVQCPVYRDGALAAPSAGTLTVHDSTGAKIIDAAAVTVTGSIAQRAITPGETSALDYGDGWSFIWALTMPDGQVHRFRNNGSLVNLRLYPTIADVDITQRVRALDAASATAISSTANHQAAIDEADIEIQLRLLEKGRRPWRVSRHPWDVFQSQRDSRQIEHHAFAVGLPSSPPIDGRQRSGGALVCRTSVGIRWAHALRADNASADYDAALVAEAQLVAAIGAQQIPAGTATPNRPFNLRIVSIDRTTTPDGLAFLGDVRAELTHTYLG